MAQYLQTVDEVSRYLTGILALGMIFAYVATKTIEPGNDNQGKAWVCYLPPSLAMSLSLCSAYTHSQSLRSNEVSNILPISNTTLS